MRKEFSRSALKNLAKVGENLYAEIKRRKKLPAGQFIAINCEPKSKNRGKYVCAPLPSDASDKFEKKFGEDMFWVRQIDFSLTQKMKNRRWPIRPM